jgi:hypothetical protein
MDKEKRAAELMEIIENKFKETILYKGNGDKVDKIDQVFVQFLRENRIYVEVFFIEHATYIIGGGKSVKIKQAGDKIVVQKGQSFYPIDKYL